MTNRVTPPPMENDPRREPNNGRPVAAGGDVRNEGPPYDRSHTAADPGHVHREEDVDNDEKRLPSESNLSLILSGVGVVLAILGVILLVANAYVLATVLAVSAVVTCGVATLLSWNDARGSPVVPGICALAALVVLIVVLLYDFDAGTKVERARDAAVGAENVEQTPDNPAAIIDPKLENDAAQPAAPKATPQ